MAAITAAWTTDQGEYGLFLRFFSAPSGTTVPRAKFAPPPLPRPDSESSHRWSAESVCLVTHSRLNTSLTLLTALGAMLIHTILFAVREEAEETVTTAW